MPHFNKMLLMSISICLLTACGGGGGGGGGGSASSSGSDNDRATHSLSDLTKFYNQARLNAYQGSKEAAPISSENVLEFASILVEQIINEDALQDNLDSASRKLRYVNETSTKSTLSRRVEVNETIRCDRGGFVDISGDVNSYGIGGVLAIYRDCDLGGVILNGNGAIYFHDEEDVWSTNFYDGVTIDTGSHMETVTGSIEIQEAYYDPIYQTSTIRTLVNLHINKNDISHMLESFEALEIQGRYRNAVTGKIYLPDYGYVDVSTLSVYRHNSNDYFPEKGDIQLTGAANSGRLFFDDHYSRLYLDNNGDGEDELATSIHFNEPEGFVYFGDFVATEDVNAPPFIDRIRFTSANFNTATDIKVWRPSVTDIERNDYELSYEWRINGGEPLAETSEVLKAGTHRKGDIVSVRAKADDGFGVGYSLVSSTLVVDAPGYLSVGELDGSVQAGEHISLDILYLDPDEGDNIDLGYEYRLVFAPDGMTMTTDGKVSWTAADILFGTPQSFRFSVEVDGNADLSLDQMVTVEDSAVKLPLARSGIEVPYSPNSLWVDNFDGINGNEILVSDDGSRVMLVNLDDDQFTQTWLYPFTFGLGEKIRSVKPVDLDRDGIKEPLVITARAVYSISDLNSIAEERYRVEDRSIHSAEISNIDNDTNPEIVLLLKESDYPNDVTELHVIDLLTGELEWSRAVSGNPNSVAIGNVDSDPSLEIVTGGGQVFDSLVATNEWHHNQPFGHLIVLSDIDGNGVEEIIGSGETFGDSIRAYDAQSKSEIWTHTIASACSLSAVSIDGDYKDEILVGTCRDDSVLALEVSSNGAEELWSIDSVTNGSISIAVGDADNDGMLEVIWGGGTTNYEADAIVVANIEEEEKTTVDSRNAGRLSGMAYAGWGAISPGNEKAVFLSNQSDDIGGYDDAPRIVTMDINGRINVSEKHGYHVSNSMHVDLCDYDKDGFSEIAMPANATVSLLSRIVEVVQVYDDITEWTSFIGQDYFSPSFITCTLINDDEYEDLIYVYDDKIWMADPIAKSTIWQSGNVSTVIDLAFDRLNTQQAELVVASYNEITIYERTENGYSSRTSAPQFSCKSILIHDVDSSGNNEIICASFRYPNYQTEIIVFDHNLVEISRIKVEGDVNVMISESDLKQGDSIIVGINDVGRALNNVEVDHSKIAMLSLSKQALIWESPYFPGHLGRKAFSKEFIEGKERMVFSTDKAMYITQ